MSLVLFIQSYQQNRTFQVRVGGAISTARYLRSGVPKSYVLEPFLYIIYASDMPFNTFGTIAAEYADDIEVLTRSLRTELITYRLQISNPEPILVGLEDFDRQLIVSDQLKDDAAVWNRKFEAIDVTWLTYTLHLPELYDGDETRQRLRFRLFHQAQN